LTTPSGVSRLVGRTSDAEAAMTDSMSLYAKAASSATPFGSEDRSTTPRSASTPVGSEPGVYRLALECQDPEDALVHASERLAADEPLESLKAESELPVG
jgi:hypothetical protein